MSDGRHALHWIVIVGLSQLQRTSSRVGCYCCCHYDGNGPRKRSIRANEDYFTSFPMVLHLLYGSW